MILDPSPHNLESAASLLKEGGLVAFPTETVYGLGADACCTTAVEKIFEAKGRPSNDPLIVHTHLLEKILALPTVWGSSIEYSIRALSRFWPGPLSIIVPKPDFISDKVTAGLSTVALRIPNHPVALALLEKSDLWIAAPSANQFSYVSPTTAQHVAESLRDRVDIILDGGSCSVGIESTVLSLVSPVPTILRPGAITQEQIAEALNTKVEFKAGIVEQEAMKSPGLSAKHYAPATPVCSLDQLPNQSGRKTGLITFHGVKDLNPKDFTAITVLSSKGDLNEAAANLYAALRSLDSMGLDYIAIDACETKGLGAAIMDRVRRACSR